jgi:pilus assembly protein TadC
MDGIPVLVWMLAAAGLVFVGVQGLRGLVAIREALHDLQFERMTPPPHWPATRMLVGLAGGLPLMLVMRELGAVALIAGGSAVALGFWLTPRWLVALRRGLERQMLDELALHLDMLAVAMESGATWSAALAACVERAPAGPMRRAWQQVIMDMHSGTEPLDALRALEQRLRLQPLATLVSALRASEKLGLPPAPVLRDRARHCAAARFARAERRARAAPLKLWAAMLLCLAPCTVAVLAWPLARLLALLAG